jgi:hypothetical protein
LINNPTSTPASNDSTPNANYTAATGATDNENPPPHDGDDHSTRAEANRVTQSGR